MERAGSLLVVGLLLALPFVNWIVAWTLVRLARIKPDIHVLSERAAIAVAIAVFTTIYAVIVLNTEVAYEFFPFDTAVTVIRVAVIILGLTPLIWLWAYHTDRFN